MKTCDYRQEENVMELILKAKDIRVEFKGRVVLDIDDLEVRNTELCVKSCFNGKLFELSEKLLHFL